MFVKGEIMNQEDIEISVAYFSKDSVLMENKELKRIGSFIKKLQLENKQLKEELEKLKHKHYLIQSGRGNGKTYLLHLQFF